MALFVVSLSVLVAAAVWSAKSDSGAAPRDAADPPGSLPTSALPTGALPTSVLPVRLSEVRQYDGPDYGLLDFRATADSNQTKLWFAGGSWWGVLADKTTLGTHIFGWQGQRWRDTGVVVDDRPRNFADVVWTGSRLFVATRTASRELRLARFRLSSDLRWTPEDTVPRTIAGNGATSLSIDVDSRDRVWAVFNQDQRIWVTHSTPEGTDFAPARPLPRPSSVKADDTVAVVAVDGKVAVLWSDQVRGAFRFAIRRDDQPPQVLQMRAPPLSGPRSADGHIRLLATRDGRIFAAVKTSLGDAAVDPPRSPLLVLLSRSPKGRWTRHVVATTADKMTRPQIVLTENEEQLYFFATSPQFGGRIYVKVADTRTLAFAPGKGTPILDAPGALLNDATVARAPASRETGILVLASDVKHSRYHTARIPLGSN